MIVSDKAKIFRTLSDDLAKIAHDMENDPNMHKGTLLRKCAEGKALIVISDKLITREFTPAEQEILGNLTIEATKLLYEISDQLTSK